MLGKPGPQAGLICGGSLGLLLEFSLDRGKQRHWSHGPHSKEISKAVLLRSPSRRSPPSSAPTQGPTNTTEAGLQPPLCPPPQLRAWNQDTSSTMVDRGPDVEFTFPCKVCGVAHVLWAWQASQQRRGRGRRRRSLLTVDTRPLPPLSFPRLDPDSPDTQLPLGAAGLRQVAAKRLPQVVPGLSCPLPGEFDLQEVSQVLFGVDQEGVGGIQPDLLHSTRGHRSRRH